MMGGYLKTILLEKRHFEVIIVLKCSDGCPFEI